MKIPERSESTSKRLTDSLISKVDETKKEINLKNVNYPHQALGWKYVLEAHDQLDKVANVSFTIISVFLPQAIFSSKLLLFTVCTGNR